MNSNSTVVEEIKVTYKPTTIQNIQIKSSRDAFSVLFNHYDPDTISLQESFTTIYLNQQNMIKGIHTLSMGGITSTVVDIRLVLSIALKSASTGIVIAHNHPSGALKPSQQDLALTEKIRAACKMLDIKLLDHLIISPQHEYYSMADSGDLCEMTGSSSLNETEPGTWFSE